MTTRMLIDARHQEETRVAVLKGNRIEEFDFESAEHKQIKGNIYLAKVTRVEPSLQAAFVDYGGNRHGFLAFSEIHPDYYQIPREDKLALLAEEARHAKEEADALAAEEEADDAAGRGGEEGSYDDGLSEDGLIEADDEPIVAETLSGDSEGDPDSEDSESDGEAEESRESSGNGRGNGRRRRRDGRGGKAKASDEARTNRMALRRRYKIQDVIQRRQVMLVQVVKEERGNKGAALTTYLSLAGRYCVLMPNSAHGGGISRKISNASDRKRLKSIIAEMKLPATMGCIVRTAGLSRTKPEIKRDFDYLARLWDEIREKTLKASAPAIIHSDSDLIKRAIRDIYNRDIEEVLVEGEAGYRAAKDFMKLLMPSHARRVKSYSDPVPLFQRYGTEDQLSAMYEPVVQLKSGGYLVINPTEALVSIDINSGRSTKEHGIEATALNTNLEAAREIARQLRLRDMAGLVVIDFIDMEYGSNIRKVEKAMRDALKSDRARIQVGRISGFGLMEMSRQRLRTGVLEASTRTCPHCDGTGLVRTASSAGLSALRLLEEEAARGHGSIITLRTSQEASIYVLNNKRRDIAEIEERFGVRIEILPNGENEGAKMEVTASGPRPEKVVTFQPIIDEDDDDIEDDIDEIEEEEEVTEKRGGRGNRGERGERSERPAEQRSSEEGEGGGRAKRRRRRRGKRGRRDGDVTQGEIGSESEAETGVQFEEPDAAADADAPVEVEVEASEAVEAAEDGGEAKPKRARRGRRGGRNRKNGEAGEDGAETAGDEAPAEAPTEPVSEEAAAPAETAAEPEAEPVAEKPKRKRASRAKKPVAEAEGEAPAEAPASEVEPAAEAEPAAKPKAKRAPRKKAAPKAEATDTVAAEPAAEPVAEAAAADTAKAAEAPAESTEPPRRGWWQRTFGN
ncbi:RNAse E [Blastomonas natatoria]|uniref:Ribonuclease E n=1 Tax=Blastomonas natatoria TaxID=34015 RepID=A0A2V3V0P2_9SPHN|nr:ribonuclease E/G [Blastomonas natatoria]PXW74521.1 RNAse E [Blastomonas natatoria]